MNKDFLAPFVVFAIVFVGAAFLIVSAAVWISRGKSEFFINKKMVLGGVLISLNSMMVSGCMFGSQPTCYDTANPEPEVMCYDVPAQNVVNFDTDSSNNVVINNKITGSIFDATEEDYYYSITKDKTNDTLQQGILKVTPDDSTSYASKFSIVVKEKLASGRYWINISKSSDHDYIFDSHQINIE